MVEGFKHTDFGIIPNDWDDAQLGDVCEKIQDGNYGGSYPKSHEFIKIGIPFLTSKAIGKDGVLKIHLVDFISESKHDELKKAHLKLHDVLFTNRGASVGAIGFVDERISNGNIGPQLTLLRASEEKIVPHFLLQIMKSNFVQKQIIGQDAGSAMNFFGVGSTKKFKIPLPPTKAEQTAIATALSDADALIQKLEQLIAKKRNIKTGAMQDLLKPKEGWEVKTLGEVGDVRMCRRVFNHETKERGEIPFFKIGTFGKEPDAYISKKLYDNYRQHFSFPQKGDILISAAGTIGRTLVYDGSPSYYQDSNIVWIDNNETIIPNEFLFHVLQVVKYSTEGGTIQRLYNNILRNTKFSCPSTKREQTHIAKILSDMDNEIQELERQLEKYKMLKQGMMQSLLTGKIRLV